MEAVQAMQGGREGRRGRGGEKAKRSRPEGGRENSSVSLVKTGRAELMKNDVEAGRGETGA